MKDITWHDRWNDVIRDVLFPDKSLKDLMLIPAASQGNIKTFIEKYFIEDILPDDLVTDEGDLPKLSRARMVIIKFLSVGFDREYRCCAFSLKHIAN